MISSLMKLTALLMGTTEGAFSRAASAAARHNSVPVGGMTMSRSFLESVCKNTPQPTSLSHGLCSIGPNPLKSTIIQARRKLKSDALAQPLAEQPHWTDFMKLQKPLDFVKMMGVLAAHAYVSANLIMHFTPDDRKEAVANSIQRAFGWTGPDSRLQTMSDVVDEVAAAISDEQKLLRRRTTSSELKTSMIHAYK